MSDGLFLTASEAYTSLYDFSDNLVTIFNYDSVFHDDPDPFTADEPDMTGVCE